jgi:hypothetical protein
VRLETELLPSADRPITRSWRWALLPLGIFLASRVVDAVLLVLSARSEGSSTTYPGNGVVPVLRQPATYFNVIQNWDGQWFRSIAEHGYPSTLPIAHGAVMQNQWAFYPLFPGLVRLLMDLTGLPFGVVSAILNVALAAVAMCLVFRMVSRSASSFAGAMTVVVLSTFPSAVVFQTAYSEALTFLLIVISLWFLERRRYGAAAAAGVLLSLTRPVVLPLAFVVALHGVMRWRGRQAEPFPVQDRLRVAGVAVLLAVSFAIWPLVAWMATGSASAYTDSIGAWSRALGQPQGYVSWVSDALTGHWLVAAWLVLGLIAQTCLLLISRRKFGWPAEMRWWSLFYVAYLLVATRPQSSVVRHFLLAIVPWWPLPQAADAVRSRRSQVLLATFTGAVGLFGQFLWIRWLFIPGPHFLPTGFP